MSTTTRATASEIVRIVLEHGADKRDVCTTIVKLECDRLIEVGRQRGLEEARIALRRVA
jgi:hypothetical protein